MIVGIKDALALPVISCLLKALLRFMAFYYFMTIRDTFMCPMLITLKVHLYICHLNPFHLGE